MSPSGPHISHRASRRHEGDEEYAVAGRLISHRAAVCVGGLGYARSVQCEQVWITVRDGTRLAADLYLPDDLHG